MNLLPDDDPKFPSVEESNETCNSVHNQIADLMEKRKAVLKQLEEQGSILRQVGVKMGEPLVDSEGYPRADVDVRTARVAMANINRLKYDLKLLEDGLEKGLLAYFSASESLLESQRRAQAGK